MPSLADLPLLAAPAWIWATLLMSAFVAISAATIALARIAVRQRPNGDRPRESAPPDRPAS